MKNKYQACQSLDSIYTSESIKRITDVAFFPNLNAVKLNRASPQRRCRGVKR